MDNKNNYSNDTESSLLTLENVTINTPDGRVLFKDLNLAIEHEQVAVIGRNGIGKSTFLKTIAGKLQPFSGGVYYKTRPLLVTQELALNNKSFLKIINSVKRSPAYLEELSALGIDSIPKNNQLNHLSAGNLRLLYLMAARFSYPDMLLLDEPTEGLDEKRVKWLNNWLSKWEKGLIVVSHDRVLLSHFEHFFIISESGCRYFQGSLTELEKTLEREANDAEKKYIMNIHTLDRQEENHAKIIRRRNRKKNYGRISELERCTPKQRLNSKRSKAQVSQGKAAEIAQKKIHACRDWTLASRRALRVDLPLTISVPSIDTTEQKELIGLTTISAKFGDKYLFKDLDLSLGYDRFAVVGSNGTGKTTLLNIIKGDLEPYRGKVVTKCCFGVIEQNGTNWMTRESLLSLLMTCSDAESLEEIARVLLTHKFPMALANRPLLTLSPGERVRAALICLFQQKPAIQVLVLDEPTYSLDFLGETSLRKALKSWPGGLIVASHNREFLASIDISKLIKMDGIGGHSLQVI